MNGPEIKSIRMDYGLNQSDMARLLNVAQSSLCRWEGNPEPQMRPASMKYRLIVVMKLLAERLPREERLLVGSMIRLTLLTDGPLRCWHVILKLYYEEE